jgi:hypothetical protein
MMKSEEIGRPSAMILFKLLTKNCERQCFKLSEIACEIPKMPYTVFYMGSENAHWCTQNAENGCGFDVSRRYHEMGIDFSVAS